MGCTWQKTIYPDDAVTLDGINSAFEQWINDYATPMGSSILQKNGNQSIAAYRTLII